MNPRFIPTTRLAISAATMLLLLVTHSTQSADVPWKLPAETAKLKPGPGMEVAAGNCLLCHSPDYISTQPPLDRNAWTASVQKMREKYGAPIATNQTEILVNYLVKTYGKERPK